MLEIYQGLILGLLQGITEFLPVSSSGHLVLGEILFKIKEPSLMLNVALHFGTLAAIFIVFFKDIKLMLFSLGRLLKEIVFKRKIDLIFQSDLNIKLIILIICGSVPTAFIGLIIKKYEDFLFSSLSIVGLMLILTGSILWLSKKFNKSDIDLQNFSIKKSLLIGIIQGLAVLPGLSRSGTTVVMGLFLGLNRELAARFSFLLSIPAVLGAVVLEFKDIFKTPDFIINEVIIYGTITSFLVGYISLILLLKIVKKGRFYLFAPYCWLLGLIAVFLGL